MEIITANKLKRLWNNGIVPKLLEKLDKTRVLTSKEQVQANTNAENVAGALVVKELFNNLNSNLNNLKIPTVSTLAITFTTSTAWITAGAGKYYLKMGNVPSGKTIIGLWIGTWSLLGENENIAPYIENNAIWIMSNVKKANGTISVLYSYI